MNLLTTPFAFMIYMALAAVLYGLGRLLAGPKQPNPVKSALYSSGEEDSDSSSAPGYQPFFLLALFFAILHLGVLMLGTGGVSWMTVIYLIGLFLALVALILG